MRNTVLGVLFSLLCVAPIYAGNLSNVMPELPGWEYVQGQITDSAPPYRSVIYEFGIEPGYQGRYAVVHYQVDHQSEKFMRDWRDGRQWRLERVRIGKRSWKSLWLHHSWLWREIPYNSPAYHQETFTLLWLYNLHRQHVLGLKKF